MPTLAELRDAVDAAFATTSRGLSWWSDPHVDRAPLDEEYSRVVDPAKWRIVPARAEAWCSAAVDLGLATLEREVTVRWADDRGRDHARVDRLVPVVTTGLPLVVAYRGFGDVDINAVELGAGDPSVDVTGVPPCGCDACDSGAQEALDLVDDHVVSVITGAFRHLSDGDRTLVVYGEHRWSGIGSFDPDEADSILSGPTGWQEVSGASWFQGG